MNGTATRVDFYFLMSREWGISFAEARRIVEEKMQEVERGRPEAAGSRDG